MIRIKKGVWQRPLPPGAVLFRLDGPDVLWELGGGELKGWVRRGWEDRWPRSGARRMPTGARPRMTAHGLN